MKKHELDVLLYFLKAEYSTRELDKKLGYSANTSKGWFSWKILKKYRVRDSDKGKLFVFKVQQAKSMIKEIPNIASKHPISILLQRNKPNHLKRFLDSHIITESADSLYQIMSGETRNIIRGFFLPQKKIIGVCQFKNCNVKLLQTAHYKKSRPELFKASANKYKKRLSGKFKFDLFKIFEDYLMSHSGKKAVCFLCQKHHKEFDSPKQTKTERAAFIKIIQW